MSITLIPDIYTPSIDDDGNYIDRIPVINNGINCLCGARKDKVYDSSSFRQHIKTQKHKKWMEYMNQNKTNYYVEMHEGRELIDNQKKIIARLEHQLQSKSNTIDYLTNQLNKKNPIPKEMNLIDL
jgi:hypothetical protein